MTTITADDIRVLARSAAEDAALVRVGDEIQIAGGEASPAEVVYTKAQLIEDYGAELSDVEAEVLAAGLTAELADGAAAERADERADGAADVTAADPADEAPDEAPDEAASDEAAVGAAGTRQRPDTDVTDAPGAVEPPD